MASRLRLTPRNQLSENQWRAVMARIEDAFRLHTELTNETRPATPEETAIITDGFDLFAHYFDPWE